MLKSALAGAVALATIGMTLAHADDYADRGNYYGGRDTSMQLQSYTPERANGSNSEVSSRIAQFKSALHLNSDQQRHWPRVEAVLRDVVSRRNVQEASADDGFVRNISARASAVVLNANSIRRLVAAANPLIKSLDQDQKRTAIALARDMGFGAVAAQFE
jgi:zinc resistance-associated protein